MTIAPEVAGVVDGIWLGVGAGVFCIVGATVGEIATFAAFVEFALFSLFCAIGGGD